MLVLRLCGGGLRLRRSAIRLLGLVRGRLRCFSVIRKNQCLIGSFSWEIDKERDAGNGAWEGHLAYIPFYVSDKGLLG